MIEAFKQVFFGLFWFTADCVMIWAWLALLASLITALWKHYHD